MRRLLTLLAFTLTLGASASESLSDEATDAPVSHAIANGLAVVQKAAANYPENRSCFSCHHQTMPMLAMVEAHAFGAAINAGLLEDQAVFTRDFFKNRTVQVAAGEGVGGRSMTAVYSLWALDLAGREADDVSDALVSYLLKHQQEDGHWDLQSHRPPMQESHAMATFLAAYYMERFASKEKRDAVLTAKTKAMQWLALPGKESKTESQEDLNARLWAFSEMGGDAAKEDIERLRARILAAQHDDGGWSQEPGMASDAYATGQTLFVLDQTGLTDEHPAIGRGVAFLLASQESDGSWFVEARAVPVQKFFDNGDPHGKSQFISVAATSWAVAALSRCGHRVARTNP